LKALDPVVGGFSLSGLRAGLRFLYANRPVSHRDIMRVCGPFRLQVEHEEAGMADVIFLAIGGGAFVVFAAFAVAMNRM